MTVYVTSDTHFNHAGIITLSNRPFADVHEMNEAMITAWNDTVHPNDTVWVLGDFAFVNKYGMDVDELFAALVGKKILVRGNHDYHNPRIFKLPWESQHELTKIRDNGRRAVVCHYPLETWDGANKSAIMLHGHSHGNMRRTIPRRFDVGVDAEHSIGYAPTNLEYFFSKAAAQTYEPQDHH